MNCVYENDKSLKPMTQEELTEAFKFVYPENSKYRNEPYDMSRLSGNHCYCNGYGDFNLLPITDHGVQDGGKRYMVCRKCGGYSHL